MSTIFCRSNVSFSSRAFARLVYDICSIVLIYILLVVNDELLGPASALLNESANGIIYDFVGGVGVGFLELILLVADVANVLTHS
jgi:hypothetical protein